MRGSARRRTALTSSSLSVSFHDASQEYWNNRIRRVDIATGATTTLAGSGTPGFLDGAGGIAQFKNPVNVAIDPSGTFALVVVRRPPPYHPHPARSRRDGTPASHTAYWPHRLPHHTLRGQTSGSALPQCVLSHDASQDRSNHRIRHVDIATGATTTLAGSGSAGFLDGAGVSARFNVPHGVAIDPSGTFALVGVRRPPPCPRMPPSRRDGTLASHTA